eukprot:317026_1
MAAQQKNKWKCKYCGEGFKYWQALNMHIKLCEPGAQQQSIQTQKYHQVNQTQPTQQQPIQQQVVYAIAEGQQQSIQIQKYNKVNQQAVQRVSNKQQIQETLVSMGFQKNYIIRAFEVYEKNYGHSYNIEVITEIINHLQNEDNKHIKSQVNQQAVQLVQTQQAKQHTTEKQITQQVVYVPGEMANDGVVENNDVVVDDDPSVLYCMAVLAFFVPICGIFACCCCASSLGPRRKRACYVLTLSTILGFITGITLSLFRDSNTNSDVDTNYYN